MAFEDFDVWYDEDPLEIDDERMVSYLKFMTKVYRSEYVLRFHESRNQEKNDWVKDFDKATNTIVKDLFKVADNEKNRKLKVNKNNTETYNF